MLISDLHCDLPYKVLTENRSLSDNLCHFDLNKLNNENQHIQVFASYIDKLKTDNPFLLADSMINKFKKLVKTTNKLKLVTNKSELYNVIENNFSGAILSIEGGEALGGNIDNLKYFYDKGVRFLTLTWNHPNELGEGVGEFSQFKGLTNFGKQVVREMEKLNMVIDVSHLTEQGFYDVCDETTASFVATHSNSYKICNHKRNLTDEQFKEIVRRKGLVGINFYPLFVNGTNNANLNDLIKHIEHFLSLGGQDVISLGADFDGIDFSINEISDIGQINNLIEFMLKINFSETLIAKIMGLNVLNYLKTSVF